jgi:PPOX class probable F420-dependent enzyme
LVPVVFAVDGDHIYTAVDHKPKRSRYLQRLADIRVSPAVTLLADHYEENWDLLWWVRADGIATILEEPTDTSRGLDLLVEKYPQYQNRRPDGPVVAIAVTAWRSWSASGVVGLS